LANSNTFWNPVMLTLNARAGFFSATAESKAE
jgi:hypothetical protein